MISFTGSEPVGVQIQKDAADTVKRVGLELGGKSAVHRARRRRHGRQRRRRDRAA